MKVCMCMDLPGTDSGLDKMHATHFRDQEQNPITYYGAFPTKLMLSRAISHHLAKRRLVIEGTANHKASKTQLAQT